MAELKSNVPWRDSARFSAKKGDYLAEGKVQFTVDGSDVVAEPGTTVFLPRKTPHSFKIIGDKLMRAIILVSPSGCEKMFEELANLPPGQPDMSKAKEICNRYGVYFL